MVMISMVMISIMMIRRRRCSSLFSVITFSIYNPGVRGLAGMY